MDGTCLNKERKQSVGKVWLVGAGPGDAGLLTLKGKQLLEEADVIVYDALVGQAVLSMIPEDKESVNVGKRSCHHTKKQEEINEILLQLALQGKKVVRLKGGDPFLFGRGAEELENLQAHHIPFEVVPGVTSSIAVPAYNGIPVTHRSFASSVHIVTGHKKNDGKLSIDFEALVRTKGTLVFLMGVTMLQEICFQLQRHGMPADTPAAILQSGTCAAQRRVVATVADLADRAAQANMGAPAIIVVGQVCRLAESISWYERLPLFGQKIAVTRPRQHQSAMASRLRQLGAEVLELPTIVTKPLAHHPALQRMTEHLQTFQWILFTSPTGVTVFFDHLRTAKIDVRTLKDIRLAAVGSATEKALYQLGMIAEFVPSVFDGAHLGQELSHKITPGERVLVAGAKEGGEDLIAALGQAGAVVEEVPLYETLRAAGGVLWQTGGLQPEDLDFAVFTSASTVKGFVGALGENCDYSGLNAACIGPCTKAEADRYGMHTMQSEKATMDSLIELILTWKKQTDHLTVPI